MSTCPNCEGQGTLPIKKSLASVSDYRTCIEERTFVEGNKSLTLKKGCRYITTPLEDGTLMVMASYWAYNIPAEIFGPPTPMIEPKEQP